MSGFSEASIDVEEARRYSLRIGLSTCESVCGTSGRCSARSWPTRSSCSGFTVDQKARLFAEACLPAWKFERYIGEWTNLLPP
jgi:hypothetical protein